jgi:hypothetical protein
MYQGHPQDKAPSPKARWPMDERSNGDSPSEDSDAQSVASHSASLSQAPSPEIQSNTSHISYQPPACDTQSIDSQPHSQDDQKVHYLSLCMRDLGLDPTVTEMSNRKRGKVDSDSDSGPGYNSGTTMFDGGQDMRADLGKTMVQEKRLIACVVLPSLYLGSEKLCRCNRSIHWGCLIALFDKVSGLSLLIYTNMLNDSRIFPCIPSHVYSHEIVIIKRRPGRSISRTLPLA